MIEYIQNISVPYFGLWSGLCEFFKSPLGIVFLVFAVARISYWVGDAMIKDSKGDK
jgi:hypothetical protein